MNDNLKKIIIGVVAAVFVVLGVIFVMQTINKTEEEQLAGNATETITTDNTTKIEPTVPVAVNGTNNDDDTAAPEDPINTTAASVEDSAEPESSNDAVKIVTDNVIDNSNESNQNKTETDGVADEVVDGSLENGDETVDETKPAPETNDADSTGPTMLTTEPAQTEPVDGGDDLDGSLTTSASEVELEDESPIDDIPSESNDELNQ